MTPSHFGLASGDVIWSYTTSASPPTVGGGILGCIRVVAAGDTVTTIGLLVERDVGDGDTLELLEPLLDFRRVGSWGETPVGGPCTGSQVDWKKGSMRRRKPREAVEAVNERN